MLIYAGIDEAGYGPMLGPLCVGMTVFAVRDWAPGDPAPDLWERLRPAVARSLSDAKARGGVPIADSKRLKLANQSRTRHPLTHLERGVLAMLAARDPGRSVLADDVSLLDACESDRPASAWFSGNEISFPVGNDAGVLGIDAAQLAASMQRSGVELLGLFVRVLDEGSYNTRLAEAGSKSGLVASVLGDHLSRVGGMVGEADSLRVVADRQGARTKYGSLLSRCFDQVEPLEESARASRYAVGGRHRVILHSEAEDAHLPVALASMGAKLIRELCMARFNRYWSARMPELKPTAGYVQDARRWLREAAPVLSDKEREALIRNA
ncbi:MAG: hypothetical protein AAGA55_03845 [Planctomycetota bacterium]